MWSPDYKYYQIRKDHKRSEWVSTERVAAMINGLCDFEKEGILIYKTKKNLPWISVTLIDSKDGNYAIGADTNFEKINLIEVITSRKPETNEGWYLAFMRYVAAELNWRVILESNGEEGEELLIYDSS